MHIHAHSYTFPNSQSVQSLTPAPPPTSLAFGHRQGNACLRHMPMGHREPGTTPRCSGCSVRSANAACRQCSISVASVVQPLVYNVLMAEGKARKSKTFSFQKKTEPLRNGVNRSGKRELAGNFETGISFVWALRKLDVK